MDAVTTPAESPVTPPRRVSKVMDLRAIIAALFTVLGAIVTVLGLTADAASLEKAGGLNINLWTGGSMLVLAAVFALWLWRVPAEVPTGHEAQAGDNAPPHH